VIRDRILERALIFAQKKHNNKFRKYTGEPYISHMYEVAGILSCVTNNEICLAAGYLHDVIEDTNTSADELSNVFCSDIAEIVLSLSNLYVGTRGERHRLYVYQLESASQIAQTVKVADIISNTKSIAKNDAKFSNIYLPECENILNHLDKASIFLKQIAYAQIKQQYYFLNGGKNDN